MASKKTKKTARRINSRRKGARAEVELAQIITAAGVPSRRAQQFCGRAGDADLTCKGLDLHIEVKRTERLSISDAIAQAERDSGGRDWVVIYRGSEMPWLVIQRFDRWAANDARFQAAKAANAQTGGADASEPAG